MKLLNHLGNALSFFRLDYNQIHQSNFTLQSQELFRWIHGKFDNYAQVCETYRINPNASDMHEYVSAKFTEHSTLPNTIIASYYYGNNTSSVFRFRYYTFQLPTQNKVQSLLQPNDVLMKIYRPKPETSQNLKSVDYDIQKYSPRLSEFEYLETCDLLWKYHRFRKCYRGTLINHKAEIYSQFDPTQKLIVQDDLTLFENNIWINDRVYNQLGQLIIGNKYGIPYKLKREFSK